MTFLERPLPRPVRKDETVIAERGLYVESWLPERRSRRRPLLMLHGELAGSWLWERYLGYFASRGWEGHALNLRGHFWSETVDFETVTFDTYRDDALAAYDRLSRPPVVMGLGMGGLLALVVAQARDVGGIVLLGSALPRDLRAGPAPEPLRRTNPHYRAADIGWTLPPPQLVRENPDLTLADATRIRHLLGAESAAARRQVLAGVPIALESIPQAPRLVIAGGLDRLYPAAESERLAEWLGAEFERFDDHSHFGLVGGSESFEPVADRIRAFLESHKL